MADAEVSAKGAGTQATGSARARPQGWRVPGHDPLLAVREKVSHDTRDAPAIQRRSPAHPLVAVCQALTEGYSKSSWQRPSSEKTASVPDNASDDKDKRAPAAPAGHAAGSGRTRSQIARPQDPPPSALLDVLGRSRRGDRDRETESQREKGRERGRVG